MSREIKFRIWDDSKKEWLGSSDKDSLTFYGFHLVGEVMTVQCPPQWAVDPCCIVEQYTGLTDKNGKEIYEGDRIKIEGSDTIYTVEYGRGVWIARFGDESGDNICLYHYVQKDIVLYAEIIGNIHEPPKDFRPEHLKRMGVSISKGGKE